VALLGFVVVVGGEVALGMVVAVGAWFSVVEVGRGYPFGGAVAVFAGPPARVEQAVAGCAGEGQVDEKSLVCPLRSVQLAVSTDWFNPSIAHQCCRITRFFQGTKRGTKVHVDIASIQNYDGTLAEAVIFVDGRGSYAAELDPSAARELAADLLAAADDLDKLNH
jgi:hypothetical protein